MSDTHPGGQEPAPPLSSPDSATHRRDHRPSRFPLAMVLMCLCCLLAGVVAVVYLLPASMKSPPMATVQESATSDPAPRVQPQELPPSPDFAAEATAALATVLELKVTAEAQSVSSWAPETYAKVMADIAKAESLMAAGRYPESTALFQQISADLTNLLDTKEQRFRSLLERGESNLALGDIDGAREQAARGLAIHPENEAAISLARRVQVRDTVLEQYERVEALEQSGNFEEAAGILDEILALDDRFEPAVSAAERISKILAQRAFETSMSALYNSIERNDFNEARESLAQLKQSSADDPLVIQAEKYYTEMSSAAELNERRRQAEQFAAAEQWQDALRVYQDILASNPGAMFAAAGVDSSAKRLELDKALVKAIADPSRMQNREVRERARELLRIAENSLPGGPRLQSQVETLAKLVEWAGTEISVTLESDNLTDVTIYHVGHLGRFIERTVSLVPGTYTIVGSRAGYRDTRQTVEIGTEASSTRLTITCSEPI